MRAMISKQNKKMKASQHFNEEVQLSSNFNFVLSYSLILRTYRWSTIISPTSQSWSWRRKIWRGRCRGTCTRSHGQMLWMVKVIAPHHHLGSKSWGTFSLCFMNNKNGHVWTKNTPADPAWRWPTVTTACPSVQRPGVCSEYQDLLSCFQIVAKWSGGRWLSKDRSAGRPDCSFWAWCGGGFELTKQIIRKVKTVKLAFAPDWFGGSGGGRFCATASNQLAEGNIPGNELKIFLQSVSTNCNITVVNRMLQSVPKSPG